MKFKFWMCLVGLVFAISACNGQKSKTDNQENANSFLSLETSMGNIKIRLYDETPLHRDNIIKLAKDGYYDGVLFHRVIKDFMIQTGDPNSKKASKGEHLGNGGPNYKIPAEFVYPKYFHKRGAVSAARMGDNVNPKKESSGSQFYIVTGQIFNDVALETMEIGQLKKLKERIFGDLVRANQDAFVKMDAAMDTTGLRQLQDSLIEQTENSVKDANWKYTPEQRDAYTKQGGTPYLDGEYTVFGEVVEGMDVVDKIQNVKTGANDRPEEDVRIIKVTVSK